MKSYSFHAYGHENVLATHKNTVEFTKHKELTKRGDCILAVNADFSLDELKKLTKHKRLKIEITSESLRDVFFCEVNKDFCSDEEIVFRKSEFFSERTMGFKVTKGAADIDRALVKRLKKGSTKIKIKIVPVDFKVAVFDFDDTLEDFAIAKHHVEKKIGNILLYKYNIKDGAKIFDALDSEMINRGIESKDTSFYNRKIWFDELFKRQNIRSGVSDAAKLTDIYWTMVLEHVRLMPNSIELLKHLKEKKIKIAIISDSDGSKNIKIDRIKKLGLDKIADLIITGDDISVTKPNKKYYAAVFNSFNARPEECLMIGDKQHVDLELAHALGMTTIWIRHGDFAKNDTKQAFTDHMIHDLIEIKEIL